MEVIRGYLKLIVFEAKNGYRICKFQLEKDKSHFIFIKGFLSSLQPDHLYELTGEFVTLEKYGQNFEVKKIVKIEPQGQDEVLRYLASDLFPTIGPKTAQTIIDYYQDNVIAKIKADFDSLHNVPGLTSKQIGIIKDTFANMNKDDELIHFFNSNNLSLQVLSLLKTKYDVDQIKAIFAKDPYSLLLKDNITFKTIDKIYLTFTKTPTSNIRIGYYAWYYAKEFCNTTGDTYLDLQSLSKILEKHLSSLTKEIILAGLMFAKQIGILIFKDEKIYVSDIYHSELDIAHMLVNLNQRTNFTQERISELLTSFNHGVIYNAQQEKALRLSLTTNFLTIIGGPGTGKTTVVDGIVRLLRRAYPQDKIILAAPTGKAAKRLREKTNQKAVTIHKMLKYDSVVNQFFYNISNPLEYDILIIDEVSMVDSLLLAAIAKASLKLKKLILIGDPNQLPSVACGDVLKDIIQSDVFDIVKLDEVYRQTRGNDILELSYAIQNNDFDYNLFNKTDVKFYENSAPQEILSQIKNKYQEILAQEDNDHHQIQVLSPMYNGNLGINILNEYLQANLNPDYGQPTCKVGHRLFKVGDKVMQLKNRPDLEIYNGDVGIIVDIKKDQNLNPVILVEYDESIVEYNKELYYDITLAYACSVHKLQGSEYNHILFVVTHSFWIMLQRNLIYTAISRAKHQLYLFGDSKAFIYGVNNLPKKRKTTLTETIKKFY
ncbi:hypothetical protein P344_03875 [Spiroplasma mirum ATCC 29335]|uniref:AAA+ ATPase domain-containing protein n=1 Tax=Spiroplasma mirum ATCC 29335 TaxID=838561 RepID=W0GLM4_9MOLU|nr:MULTISPECIES: AAA family ATPase [Spiroplasma]AHF61077.1 putative exodeoxyribonuclease V alpha subunit [Spiroplasma mirum ATCC 29335]AHI58113.1 hypothetical protein P344_03875 [Spiroplasma mirum ATCC 29335]AKM53175.1 exodeoxyribonuclease V subunit alpha [Spiroplasma atrichopogonis]